MCKKFRCNQKQGEDGTTELDPFSQTLFSSKRTHSPASGWVPAYALRIPEKQKVDRCTDSSKGQHRNPEFAGVKTCGRSGCSGGDQGRKPQTRTKAPERHHCSPHALQRRQTQR